jgi:hypothetical protein
MEGHVTRMGDIEVDELFLRENLKAREYIEGLRVDDRIIL